MIVNGINQPSFSAKIKKTKNGNDYERSNEGKKYYPLIIVAGTLTSGLINIKGIIKRISEMNAATKGRFFAGMAGGAAIWAGLAVGLGAILDAIINKTRKKDADKFAETKIAQERTNKGKKICAGIGAGAAVLNVLIEVGRGKSAIVKRVITAPLVTAAWLAVGVVYDNAVNKFRAPKANKEIQA